ncbi:MAG: hypothetical protein NT020_05500 [Chloroflexales bacterium]|nr:hypothetical protein [Chloroflexales bacterium]
MYIPEDAKVLIGIIKTSADFATFVQTQHYHIPVTHAMLAYKAEFFAAYLPKWHSTMAWHIGYVAQIQRYTVGTRTDCCPHQPQHPRAAQYYVSLQLADITPCEPSIPSTQWRRVWLHVTTGAALMRTPELGQLAQTKRRYFTTTRPSSSTALFNE